MPEVDALQEKIRILERALRFYGNVAHYGDRGEYWTIVIDEGKTARKAIKEVAAIDQEEET